MNASELVKKIEEYGGNMKEIRDRFAGNDELYQDCFTDLVNETNVQTLEKAIADKNYDEAFKAAHALKGLIGNLGLTDLHNAVTKLVEVLRAKRYADVEAKYETVREQWQRLLRCTGNAPSEPAPAPAVVLPEIKQPRQKKKTSLLIGAVAFAAVIAAVVALFGWLLHNYNKNAYREALAGITQQMLQLQSHTEQTIDTQWNTVSGLAVSLAGNFDADTLDAYLKGELTHWNAEDIIIYTQDGDGISLRGDMLPQTVAAKNAALAEASGAFMECGESTVTYTASVQTALQYRGKQIVAVALVQKLSTLFDESLLAGYDGATLYLTRDNADVLCVHPANAAQTDNLLPQLRGEINPIDGDTDSAVSILTCAAPKLFRWQTQDGTVYLAAAPIETRQESLRLFFLVPEADVQRAKDTLLRDVTVLCILLIAAIILIAVAVLVQMYRSYRIENDSLQSLRARTMELLSDCTPTVVALLSIKKPQPLFVSGNVRTIIGNDYYRLEKTELGFQIHSSTDEETDALRRLNVALVCWDGKSEFYSDYLQNEEDESRWFTVQIFPVPNDAALYIGVAQDMTRAHTLAAQTKAALEKADRANAAKSSFLSSLSHDIRTPMNAIVNMTHFARENIKDVRKADECLQVVEESSDHLLHLVNDVLDMSRIESGQAVIASEPFDLMVQLKELADIVRSLCNDRKQLFFTDFSGVKNCALLGDEMKVSQIMLNLLSNAVKFTPEKGAVRFAVREEAAGRDDSVQLCFSIEDTGIGISKKDLQKIFDPFTRVDDKRISQIEGTGLGLSICKSYIDAMGGTLECDSEEGEGSVFTVHLTFAKADYVPETHIDPLLSNSTPFIGRHCLVVEDNRTNQVIAKTLLERLGFMVDTASDGSEALSKFKKSRSGYFDIIYMDVQMPVMDGYQVTIAIRNSAHPQAKGIPIVAMTANVFAEDIEKSRIAGMNGHLSKPITTLELISETSRVLNNPDSVYKHHGQAAAWTGKHKEEGT